MSSHLATISCLTLAATCASQTNWKLIRPATSPPARWQHAMSYDFTSGRVLVFGGRSPSGGYLSDTWEYDGSTWKSIATTRQPIARWLTHMVHDRARRQTVLFGGIDSARRNLGDTWIWDGILKTWTQAQPANSPSARLLPAMAYDSTRQRVVLFGGGSYMSDTWEWDGVNWTRINTPISPPGRRSRIAYDPGRQRMVLHGGDIRINVYDGETWEYDGRTWTRMRPLRSPGVRTAAALEYDPLRRRIVLFGGFSQAFQNLGDTWEYDGVTWTPVNPPTAPSARRGFDHSVYDAPRQRVVMFGGRSNATSGETWEYSGPERLTVTPPTISIATGGTQTFALNAGSTSAARLYWLLGSLTGTTPGVSLPAPGGLVTVPLNLDFWTNFTIGSANTATLSNTRGVLDPAGKATATFNVPRITFTSAIGLVFHHAYLVYDTSGNFNLASNPVKLTLVR